MHTNFRDCQAWREQSLPMSTSSNEACKLYDAVLSQLVGYYELPEYEGLEGTLNSMLAASPDFVLGHTLKAGIFMLGSSHAFTSSSVSAEFDTLISLAQKQRAYLSRRERLHVNAIQLLRADNILGACDTWEQILFEHPTDMQALKFVQNGYFQTGLQAPMRDSVARMVPLWSRSLPMYGYLYGMRAFGYAQTNYFHEAEKSAWQALEMNEKDTWARHALCHVNEYKCTPDAGIKMLRDSESHWSSCEILAGHNYWHWCLYHMDKHEHETAIEILDEHIIKRALSGKSSLDMLNATSLMLRLQMDENKCARQHLDEHWLALRDVFKGRFHDHGYLFNDAHVLSILCQTGTKKELEEYFEHYKNSYLKSLEEPEQLELLFKEEQDSVRWVHSRPHYTQLLNQDIGPNLLESIYNYRQGEYERVVDLLYPVRYKLLSIGHSNAQRDLFNLMLLDAALKSKGSVQQRLGLYLLNERLALKEKSQLTQRIAARFALIHMKNEEEKG